jgi:subtilisin family serine protease
MKKNKLIGQIFAIAIILILLATGLPFSGSLSVTVPVVSASDSSSISKISSLLSLRVKMKTSYLAKAGTLPQGQVALPEADTQASGDLTQLNHEKVFLYFMQRPTAANLSDLAALGVTTYPDSWIPPVGNHPTGFILADMPVDKLDVLAAKDYIVNLDTAEETDYPQNNLARTAMGVDSVWSGGDTGAGVTVAVLDSGIDTSNPDFPPLNTSNSKDYSNYPTLDDTITNTVTGHGTHVTGSVLGRGVNSATYKGVAPGANLVFLKIGDDITSDTSIDAEVGAIRAAVDIYHADIITMSYGGWSATHDGSDAKSQAVDYAVSQGATVFISAGNKGALGWHYSGTVAPNSTTDFIQLNLTGGSGYNTGLAFNLAWYDGLGMHNGLSLKYYNSSHTELTPVIAGVQSESSKGTENVYSHYNYYVSNGTYYLKVQNTSGSSQSFHIYYDSSYNRTGYADVQFASPDPNYTLDSPAEADGAIAVGAYVSRKYWTNYQGDTYNFINPVETLNSIATFSSRGPRVDSGAPAKPEVVAPGSAIISVRDPIYTLGNPSYDPSIIDNDGLNLGPTNTGPANYFVLDGTSMACPLAAGVGALLLSKNPALTPAQIKNALEITATDKGIAGFDNIYGYGLVNASAAINLISTPPTVITNAAGSITANSATLNGNLTAMGTATTVTICFEWGNTTSYGNQTPTQVMTGPGAFSGNISGLKADTTYHFRAKAMGDGTSYGNDTTFTTTMPPSVTTNAAGNITANSAFLNGNLTAIGTATTVTVSFQWGTTTSYGNETAAQIMAAPGAFSGNITGLNPNTTYHFRAKAIGNGTSYGNDTAFPSSPMPPSVVTNAAGSITTSSATLNGNLTAKGTATSVTVSFEWGNTTGYGNQTSTQIRAAPGAFSGNITGLNPNTTYHFRAKAIGNGTSYGNDTAFTTSTVPPTAITNAAGNITANSAILNGNLTAMGTATSVTVSFEWGNTTSYGNETPSQVMTGTGAFSGNITSLNPITTYHFRAKAIGNGTSYGNDTTLTTAVPPVPTIRHLPGIPVSPGQTFDVTVTFTAPADNFNSIGLADNVPTGWTVQGNLTACTPNPTNMNIVGSQIQFLWMGNYTAVTVFTVPYTVTVPGNATAGNYTFSGTLGYHIGGGGLVTENIAGDSTVQVSPGTPVTGITREVNGNILPGVSITLDGVETVVSDQSGQYQIMANSTGSHTVVAHKDGFRDRTQIINVAGLGSDFAVTYNFQGLHGLIPNAPDIWYALNCVNRWLYPPGPDTGLDIWTALDVINAWLYPVQ